LGRQARLQPLPVAHVTALICAADVRYVGRNRVLAHLDRGTVEADVGDVVLPAPIGAARHLDVDPAGELIVELHLRHSLADRLVEAHRAGDPELARIRPRAGHDVGYLIGAGLPQTELAEALPDLVKGLVAHPAQN